MLKFNVYVNGVTYNHGVVKQKALCSQYRAFSIDKPQISYKVINDIVYLTIENITYILSIDEFQNLKSTLPKSTLINIV